MWTAHLRNVKSKVQGFPWQSLGGTIPHSADLQVGQIPLRVAVGWVNQASRARHDQLQDI